MTRREYARRVWLGWACYHVVMTIPIRMVPNWVLSGAGFYANDEGYDAYMEFMRERDK
jgi:hypothetical protein